VILPTHPQQTLTIVSPITHHAYRARSAARSTYSHTTAHLAYSLNTCLRILFQHFRAHARHSAYARHARDLGRLRTVGDARSNAPNAYPVRMSSAGDAVRQDAGGGQHRLVS